MDYKFNKIKNWNVNEHVYNTMYDYYKILWELCSYAYVLCVVEQDIKNDYGREVNKSTLKRAYRRMKKVINWYILQHELKARQWELDKQTHERAKKLRLEADIQAKFFGTVILIASLVIIGIVLFHIFNYNV